MRVNTSKAQVIFKRMRLLSNKKVIVLLIYELSAIPKIDNKYFISFFAQAHQEILRVNIVVDQIFRMHPLDSINELVDNEQSSFETEPSLTKLQQVFE